MGLIREIAKELLEINWYWWIVVFITSIVIALLNRKRIKSQRSALNKISIVMFWPYCEFILLVTLLNREFMQTAIVQEQWMPFESYRILFSGYGYPGLKHQIIMNYVLFIPFGLFFYFAFERLKGCLTKVVFCALVFSLAIETAQLVLGLGLFEFDDLFGNTVGAFIGGIIGKVLYRNEIVDSWGRRIRKACKRDC